MQFRQIHVEDIPELFEVRIATWDNARGAEELAALGITPESVCAMLQSSHRGWLCDVHGRVVGFAIGDGETGEMWVIAVLKEYEGRGIGRRLLGLVEAWLWSRGWEEIWLTTDTDGTCRAVGFYRHLGWEDWKIDLDRFMKKKRPRSLLD